MVFVSGADLDKDDDALHSKPQHSEPVSTHHSLSEASNVCKVSPTLDRPMRGWEEGKK
jgi:hypothetical protein